MVSFSINPTPSYLLIHLSTIPINITVFVSTRAFACESGFLGTLESGITATPRQYDFFMTGESFLITVYSILVGLGFTNRIIKMKNGGWRFSCNLMYLILFYCLSFFIFYFVCLLVDGLSLVQDGVIPCLMLHCMLSNRISLQPSLFFSKKTLDTL